MPPNALDTRHRIPCYNAPPDRAVWQRRRGVAPFRLDAQEKFLRRAAAAVERDRTTLERTEAIAAQTELDEVCERVAADADLEACPVFFDPETPAFWAYPLRPEDAKAPALTP